MLKKYLKVALVVLVAGCLTACTSAQTQWLQGKWESKNWDTTYEFKEKSGQWSVSDKDNEVLSKAELKEKDKTNLELVDKDGNKLVIKKEGETSLSLRMVNSDGMAITLEDGKFSKKK